MANRRKKARITQRAMAAKLDMDPSGLCRLEKGEMHWLDEVFANYEAALVVLAAEGGGR